MRRPVCTVPRTALSYTIFDRDRPVPVGLAGYRLYPGHQYTLRVQPLDPGLKGLRVILHPDEGVEVHESRWREGAYEVLFVMRDSGPSFIPFRLLAGVHSLRADVVTEAGGSQGILVPVMLVNGVRELLSGIQLLWYVGTFLVSTVLVYLLAFFGWQFSGWVANVAVFLLIMLADVLVMAWLAHGELRQRARTLRAGLPEEEEEEV